MKTPQEWFGEWNDEQVVYCGRPQEEDDAYMAWLRRIQVEALACGARLGIAAAQKITQEHEDREFRDRDNELMCYARHVLHDVNDEIDQLDPEQIAKESK